MNFFYNTCADESLESMDSSSLTEQNLRGRPTSDKVQSHQTGAQKISFASSNMMNTGSFVTTDLSGINPGGEVFNSIQGNSIRLAGIQSNGTGFMLPHTSANGLFPNRISLIPLNSPMIAIPQLVNMTGLNAFDVGLVNLNNVGLVAVPAVQQRLMVTTAPILTSVNPCDLIKSKESSISRENDVKDTSFNSSKIFCRQANRQKVTKVSRSAKKQVEFRSAATKDSASPCKDYSLAFNVTSSSGDVRSKKKKSSVEATSFPLKLHEILSRKDLESIISWMPHGRSWRVHKHKEFEEKVLSQYFRHNKYNSFTRQVNGWGFRRITQGSSADHNSYYHELFLRGLPHLCTHMCRLNAVVLDRSDACIRVEPDFYRMDEIAPLPKKYSKASASYQDLREKCNPSKTEERNGNLAAERSCNVNAKVSPSCKFLLPFTD